MNRNCLWRKRRRSVHARCSLLMLLLSIAIGTISSLCMGNNITLALLVPIGFNSTPTSLSMKKLYNASIETHKFGIEMAQKAGFLRNVGIKLLVIDTAPTLGIQVGLSVFKAQEAIQNGAVGILAAGSSDAVAQISYVTAPLQLPICASAAAAHALSDKKYYPYLYRIVAAAKLKAQGYVDCMQEYGWNRLSVLTEPGVGITKSIQDEFLKRASASGITILFQSYMPARETLGLLFGGIYTALVAQDTRILFLVNYSDLGAHILVELWKRQWFKSQRRVILVANDIHSDLNAIDPTAFKEIVTSAAILNVDPTAFPKQQHDDLFTTFKEDYRIKTGSVFDLTDAGAPNSYTCGYTMVMGLHRLLENTPNGSIAQLAARNQGMFSRMNISLFNATNLPEASEGNGLRPLPLIDESGDQVVSTTIVYAFFISLFDKNDADPTRPIAYIPAKPESTAGLEQYVWPGGNGEIPTHGGLPVVVLPPPEPWSSPVSPVLYWFCWTFAILLLGSLFASVWKRHSSAFGRSSMVTLFSIHVSGILTVFVATQLLLEPSASVCSGRRLAMVWALACLFVPLIPRLGILRQYLADRAYAMAEDKAYQEPDKHGTRTSRSRQSHMSRSATSRVKARLRMIKAGNSSTTSDLISSEHKLQLRSQRMVRLAAALDAAAAQTCPIPANYSALSKVGRILSRPWATTVLLGAQFGGLPAVFAFGGLTVYSVFWCQPCPVIELNNAKELQLSPTAVWQCTCRDLDALFVLSVWTWAIIGALLAISLVLSWSLRGCAFNAHESRRIFAVMTNQAFLAAVIFALAQEILPSKATIVTEAATYAYAGVSGVLIYVGPLYFRLFTSSVPIDQSLSTRAEDDSLPPLPRHEQLSHEQRSSPLASANPISSRAQVTQTVLRASATAQSEESDTAEANVLSPSPSPAIEPYRAQVAVESGSMYDLNAISDQAPMSIHKFNVQVYDGVTQADVRRVQGVTGAQEMRLALQAAISGVRHWLAHARFDDGAAELWLALPQSVQKGTVARCPAATVSGVQFAVEDEDDEPLISWGTLIVHRLDSRTLSGSIASFRLHALAAPTNPVASASDPSAIAVLHAISNDAWHTLHFSTRHEAVHFMHLFSAAQQRAAQAQHQRRMSRASGQLGGGRRARANASGKRHEFMSRF